MWRWDFSEKGKREQSVDRRNASSEWMNNHEEEKDFQGKTRTCAVWVDSEIEKTEKEKNNSFLCSSSVWIVNDDIERERKTWGEWRRKRKKLFSRSHFPFLFSFFELSSSIFFLCHRWFFEFSLSLCYCYCCCCRHLIFNLICAYLVQTNRFRSIKDQRNTE